MLPDVPSFNVIGEIRGSVFPDEIIVAAAIWIAGIWGKVPRMMEPAVYKVLKIIRALKAQQDQTKAYDQGCYVYE